MEPKDFINNLLQNELSRCEDDLRRAERQFKGYGLFEMNQIYGGSDKTGKDILNEYKDQVATVIRAKVWLDMVSRY